MRDISMIICLVVALMVVIAMILYQKMDKHRYMAVRYIQRLDEDFRIWLEAAVQLLEFDYAGEKPIAEYKALVEEYNGVKHRHAQQRVQIINRIHALVRDTAVANFDYPGVRDICVDLGDKAWVFAGIWDEYNHYAEKLNTDLASPVGGFVGKLFRVKKFERLDDLSIP